MVRSLVKERLGIGKSQDWEVYLNDINIGFNKIKLEKDFYLTEILNRIADNLPELIFKGGTCLNKIHFGYYRLSEDLDFVILTTGGDNVRERLLKAYKQKLSDFMETLGCKIQDGRTRFDSNTQGSYRFFYKSFIDGSEQEIKIDIHIQSVLMEKTQYLPIKHIFTNTLTGESVFKQKNINCMHIDECMAEKVRAGLTRIKPAIRDLFDIRYAKNQGYDFQNIKLLINKKVEEAENIYTLEDNYENLKKQIDTDLSPVLGDTQGDFDFDQIYSFILSFKH